MDEEPRDSEDRKPVWQASEAERQIDADAYHIWTPRPLIRSVYWRPGPEPPRDAVSGSYEVFLDQRAFVAMHEHVWKADLGGSQFGYLIGDLCEDPAASRRFVIITTAVPSRFPFLEAGPEQISAEASVALQLEVERRRGVLVGWYHSHPTGDAVLSPEDVETHDRLFADPWQVAFLFVSDPHAPAGACFRRTPDGFDGQLRLPFYEMVTNESLLAKGVRRSRVDWENVSTLDEVRSEPPPRPEPPTRPGPAPSEVLTPGATDDQAPEAKPDAEPEAEPELTVEAEEEIRIEVEAEVPEIASEADEEQPAEAPSVEGEGAPDGVADDAVVEEDEGELDFDALIAEVTNGGLPGDSEGPEAEDTETAYDLDVGLEPDMEAVPVPDPDAAPDGGLAYFPESEIEVEEEEIPESEPSAPVAEPEGLESPEPAEAPEAPVDDESQLISEALVEAESELTSPPPEAVEPLSVPDAPTVSVPDASRMSVPAPDKGRKLRHRILTGAGIVIALGVVGVIVQLLVRDSDSSTDAAGDSTPAVVDRPVGEPPAGAEVPGEALDSALIVVPTPVEVEPVSLEELEGLSDRVLESISRYYGRDGAYSGGEIGCPELQSSFAEVMDHWIDYSTRGKAGWQGRLPPDLVERDERLYLGVQDVERLFEASSCPRP